MNPRLPAAFQHLAHHPLDLLISTQPAACERDKLRRIRIYYGKQGAYFSFEFNLLDAPYNGDRSKMLRAAVKALLTEVKSRALLGHDFNVLYYEEQARVLVEQEVSQLISEQPAWRRISDKLLLIEKLVTEK